MRETGPFWHLHLGMSQDYTDMIYEAFKQPGSHICMIVMMATGSHVSHNIFFSIFDNHVSTSGHQYSWPPTCHPLWCTTEYHPISSKERSHQSHTRNKFILLTDRRSLGMWCFVNWETCGPSAWCQGETNGTCDHPLCKL
jgi:hypothetical protein